MKKIVLVTFYASLFSAVSYGTPVSSVRGRFSSSDRNSNCLVNISDNAVDLNIAYYMGKDQKKLADQLYEVVDLKSVASVLSDKISLLYKNGVVSQTIARPTNNGDIYKIQEVSFTIKDDKLNAVMVKSKLSNHYNYSVITCDNLFKLGELSEDYYIF